MKRIVIHCSATKPNVDASAADIDRWHRQANFRPRVDPHNGLIYIGYNLVIRKSGALEEGRREGEFLQHAKGFQDDSLAVCMVGGLDEVGSPIANFTDAQWKSLKIVVDFWSLKYPDAKIMGHRDLPGVMKDCPCFDVAEWRRTGSITSPRKIV